MENRSENSGQRTIHFLVVMSALSLFLALISLSIPLDVYAVGELAFIGSPTPPIWYTPPPNGTPEPPLDTPHTVVLVKDFYPGNNYSGPSEFAEYNGELYFAAYGIDEYDNSFGVELFKYDGTETYLVADIYPDEKNSSPENFLVFNGDLYFSAKGLDNFRNEVGTELYKFDGASVQLVADIYPGPTGSNPSYLTIYQGELYFAANGIDNNDQDVGSELYKYDGSEVVLVHDFNPGITDSSPRYLTVFNDSLYVTALIATPGNYKYKLHKFDGSVVTQISETGATSEMFEYQGMLYFAADGYAAPYYPVGDELFRLNGDTVELVADLAPGYYFYYSEVKYYSSYPSEFTLFQDDLFFKANGDLYSFDGTEIHLLREEYPWPGHPEVFYPEDYLILGNIAVQGNNLYVSGRYYDNYVHAILWGMYQFNGSRFEFIENLYAEELFSFGNELLTTADDFSGIGYELWKLDNIPDRETDTEILYFAPDIVEVGEPFKVRVSVQTGDGGTPTGIVDVGDGGGNNCQTTLVNGGGSCTLTLTEVGFQPIYARYEWATEYLSSSDEDFQAVAPLAPASIDATYRTDPDIQVSWDPVAGATFYKLYRATSEVGVQEDVYTGTDLHFTDTGVSYQDYYYWVRACYDVICSDQAGHVIGARQDLIPPDGSFTAPLQNGSLGIPRALISVNAFDGETGVQAVDFWIDKGSGWELLGTDTDRSNGWKFQLSTANLGVNTIKLKAVIKDQANNISLPLVVTNISTSGYQTNLGGYEARESSGIEAAAPGQILPEQDAGYPSAPSGIKSKRLILME